MKYGYLIAYSDNNGHGFEVDILPPMNEWDS